MAEIAIEAEKAYCSFLSNSSSCTSSIDHLPRVAEKEEGGSGCQLGLSVSPASLPSHAHLQGCLPPIDKDLSKSGLSVGNGCVGRRTCVCVSGRVKVLGLIALFTQTLDK